MNIIKLNATDSTNTYLSALSKNTTLEDEIIVVTNNQKNGRGQRNSIWQSQPDNSLIFSLFKRLGGVAPQEQFSISMVVSIAIANSLQALTNAAIQIKWPNDIMADGKKCGGILIENQIRGNTINNAIIGVGINVNEDSFVGLPQATSLFQVSGMKQNLEALLKMITSEIFLVLKNLDVNDLIDIQSKYHSLLFKKGVLSSYKLPGGNIFNGTISGVLPSGQLLIKLPDGESLKFWNKEIEMLY